jgi:hypothetical protein
VRDNYDELLRYLNSGNCFRLFVDSTLHVDGIDNGILYLHAYPGIWQETLLFFCIADFNDTLEMASMDTISICTVFQQGTSTLRFLGDSFASCVTSVMKDVDEGILGYVGDNEISPVEAQKRIQLWDSCHDAWINDVVNIQHDKLYEVFVIPSNDLNLNIDYYFRFALNPDDPIKGHSSADLIVVDKNGSVIPAPDNSRYWDLVRPVPPYKAEQGLQPEAFYLWWSSVENSDCV